MHCTGAIIIKVKSTVNIVAHQNIDILKAGAMSLIFNASKSNAFELEVEVGAQEALGNKARNR